MINCLWTYTICYAMGPKKFDITNWTLPEPEEVNKSTMNLFEEHDESNIGIMQEITDGKSKKCCSCWCCSCCCGKADQPKNTTDGYEMVKQV
eukprot:UN27501